MSNLQNLLNNEDLYSYHPSNGYYYMQKRLNFDSNTLYSPFRFKMEEKGKYSLNVVFFGYQLTNNKNENRFMLFNLMYRDIS